eukprot:12404021-Karenia_brevis.AAC.1
MAVQSDPEDVGTSCNSDGDGQGESAWTCELLVNGRIVIFTDGACAHNQDNRLRRAGSGVFWAEGHPKNIACKLLGPVQSNQRAELQACILAVQSESRRMEIRTDSQYVYDGVAKSRQRIRRRRWQHIDNGDLWKELDKLLMERAMEEVMFTKIKGHAKFWHIKQGLTTMQNKIGNDWADSLARQGAREHEINKNEVCRLLEAKRLAIDVQNMMIDIVLARSQGQTMDDVEDTDAGSEVVSVSSDDDIITISSESDSGLSD